MSSAAGQVVFLGALAGMAIGLVVAGVMSLDVIKETDVVANNMVRPAAPPSPPSPPNLRRLDETPKQTLFAFSAEEEKRVLREVQQSMTSARAAAAAKGGA